MTEEITATAPSEAAAAAAHEIDQRIRRTVRAMKGAWVQLAGELYRFNRSGMWRDLGYETFEEYLEQPDLELRRRWVYELIGMYEQLVIERDVPAERLSELNSSKVREVLPAVRRGRVTLAQAFSDAETLSRPDLQERYRGLTSMPDPVIDPAREPVTRGPTPAAPASSSAEAIRSERVPCEHCGGRGWTLEDES